VARDARSRTGFSLRLPANSDHWARLLDGLVLLLRDCPEVSPVRVTDTRRKGVLVVSIGRGGRHLRVESASDPAPTWAWNVTNYLGVPDAVPVGHVRGQAALW